MILVPFIFDASEVQMGELDNVLRNAPAAFPNLLSIGNQLSRRTDELQSIRDEITRCLPDIDSRLSTQYSLSVLCCKLVR